MQPTCACLTSVVWLSSEPSTVVHRPYHFDEVMRPEFIYKTACHCRDYTTCLLLSSEKCCDPHPGVGNQWYCLAYGGKKMKFCGFLDFWVGERTPLFIFAFFNEPKVEMSCRRCNCSQLKTPLYSHSRLKSAVSLCQCKTHNVIEVMEEVGQYFVRTQTECERFKSLEGALVLFLC